MVVDAVIQHWVMVVTGEEAETDGFGSAFQMLAGLFYKDQDYLYPHGQTGFRRPWKFRQESSNGSDCR